MKLPKAIYVLTKDEGGEEYLLASADMSELGIEVGDKVKIGLYKLEGTYDAEGMIETSKLRPINKES